MELRARIGGVAVMLAASAACGSSVDAPGTGGAGGAGATTATSASTSATTASTTGEGGFPAVCELDRPEPVDVEIANGSSERIWFAGSGFGRVKLAGITVDGNGESSCPCDDLASCSGAQASVSTNIGYLDPGQSFVEVWEQLFYFDDPACTEELACEKGRRAGDGNHTMTVTAYRGAPFCDEACDCNLSEGNVCNYGEAAEAPTDPVTQSASFEVPIEIDDEAPAFFFEITDAD